MHNIKVDNSVVGAINTAEVHTIDVNITYMKQSGINDTSGVFDEIAFPSTIKASRALHRNGFRRFSDEHDLQPFLRQPSAPFHRSPHPNGPIYSSGRFWQS
jgi:hypothetical protein